jgi:hypothetical protein
VIVAPGSSPSGKAIRKVHFAPSLHDVEAPLHAFADMSAAAPSSPSRHRRDPSPTDGAVDHDDDW